MEGFFCMSENQQVPKFAHLDYRVLHELDISINEYFFLDMIFHLSGSGRYWCIKKLENIAFDMRLSKRGVTDIRNRLIEKKLLLKGVGNRLRTSEKVQKVYFLDEAKLEKVQKVQRKVQNLHPKSAENVAKTPVENNRRLTIEKKDDFGKAQNPTVEGQGYAKAKERYALLKRRVAGKVGVN